MQVCSTECLNTVAAHGEAQGISATAISKCCSTETGQTQLPPLAQLHCVQRKGTRLGLKKLIFFGDLEGLFDLIIVMGAVRPNCIDLFGYIQQNNNKIQNNNKKCILSYWSGHISHCQCSYGLQSCAIVLPLTNVCVHALSFCLLNSFRNTRMSLIKPFIATNGIQLGLALRAPLQKLPGFDKQLSEFGRMDMVGQWLILIWSAGCQLTTTGAYDFCVLHEFVLCFINRKSHVSFIDDVILLETFQMHQ